MPGCELSLRIHLFFERFILRPSIFKSFDLDVALGALHNNCDHARSQESPLQQQQQPLGCNTNTAEVEEARRQRSKVLGGLMS